MLAREENDSRQSCGIEGLLLLAHEDTTRDMRVTKKTQYLLMPKQ